MVSLFASSTALSESLSGFNRYRQSLLSGFKTFLPPDSSAAGGGTGDVFVRSGSD